MVAVETAAPAPESAGNADLAGELRLIRQLLETQSKQLEALTQEVSGLRGEKESQVPDVPRAVAAGALASPLANSVPPAPSPDADTVPANASMPPAPSPAPPTGPTYTVKAGETLTSIAKQFNTTIAKLMDLNRITDGRKLQIGQTLVLPAPEPQPPTPQETP